MPFCDPATQYGGPVSQLRSICQGMASRGHHVRVVTTDMGLPADWPRDHWVDRGGFQVWYSSTRPWQRVAPFYTPGLLPVLRDALAAADVLHLQLGLTFANVHARRAAREAGVPYVYTPHGVLCPVRLRAKRFAKAAFLRLYERAVIRDAAALQALTGQERADLLAQGASWAQIQVIPNGIHEQEFAAPATHCFRERFQIPAETPLVLFMGRLQKIKGLDLLVNSFARVHADIPHAVLAIAGPDEDCGASLRRQVNSLGLSAAVKFTGPLNGELRLAALHEADVFALTSYSEGLPMAVLEACACGLPVVITEQCHLPEVAEYAAGFVEPADAGRLAAGIGQLLGRPELRRRMGANGRRLIREHFSMDRVLSQLEETYHRLAKASE